MESRFLAEIFTALSFAEVHDPTKFLIDLPEGALKPQDQQHAGQRPLSQGVKKAPLGKQDLEGTGPPFLELEFEGNGKSLQQTVPAFPSAVFFFSEQKEK